MKNYKYLENPHKIEKLTGAQIRNAIKRELVLAFPKDVLKRISVGVFEVSLRSVIEIHFVMKLHNMPEPELISDIGDVAYAFNFHVRDTGYERYAVKIILLGPNDKLPLQSLENF